MRRDELRRAIELPAERAGLHVERALVDVLLADVEAQPGALPLLSTALLALWQQRDGTWLRLSACEGSGGVRRAVAGLAEEVYRRLDEDGRSVARHVLPRLVRDGGDGSARTPSRRPRTSSSERRPGRPSRGSPTSGC